MKIGTYATSLTYYPNGAVDTFTYGNGIAHSMTQTSDGRQLPAQSKDVGVPQTVATVRLKLLLGAGGGNRTHTTFQ